MATFARSTFSHAGYAAFRPSYPPTLYRVILNYHNQSQPSRAASAPPRAAGTLVDVGCGHGVVAQALAPHFARVVALDPSAGMIAQAKAALSGLPNATARQGSAEDLSSAVEAGSVDCAVAGQAAHWFDWSRAWPQLANAVRPGGSIAFWGYKDHVVVGRPAASAAFFRYTYDKEPDARTGMETMARFWELPGRDILRHSYPDVVPPESDWEDVRKVAWDPDRETAIVPEELGDDARWMVQKMKLGELEGYVRTYSAFGGWRDAHPDIKSRAQGGEGDVVDLMFDQVVDSVPEWKTLGDKWKDEEVEVAWGTVLLMARRRK